MMSDTVEPRPKPSAARLVVAALLLAASVQSRADAPLYNATLHAGAPAFGARMIVVYEPLLFAKGTLPGTPLPSDEGIEAAARNAAAQRAAAEARGDAVAPVVALSIERWVAWPHVSPAEHAIAIADYADTARRFGEASGEKVCLFDVFPGGGMPAVVRTRDEPELREEWEEAVRSAWKVLEGSVDAFCPKFYTYYDHPDPEQHDALVAQWKGFALDTVAMAREVAPSVPIYPFVWPHFHPGGNMAGREVPADYWRTELDTLRDVADGVVVWGGFDTATRVRRDWAPDAAWWRVTRDVFGARAAGD